MSKKMILRDYPRAILLSAAVAVCLPALSAQDLHGWSVDSKVASLELVAVEQTSALALFRLKNVSSKPVTAFIVVTPDDVEQTVDYFGSDMGDLAPGAVETVRLSAVRFPEGVRTLHLEGVLFADGGAEGPQQRIDVMKATRLGDALETERIRRILSTPRADPTVGDVDLDSLSMRIGKLPTSSDSAVASLEGVNIADASVDSIRGAGKSVLFGFRVGVANIRENALRSLVQVKALPAGADSAARVPGASVTRSVFLNQILQRYGSLNERQMPLLTTMKGAVR